MSRYTVYDLAVDVKKKLHNVPAHDLPSSLDEARRNMIGNIKPPEMVRSATLEQALYDQINKYAIPEDLKYDNVIEIKMLSGYRNVDTLQHPLELVYRRQFDQKRRNARNVLAISNENGVKYAMIYHPKGLKRCQHLIVNDMNSLMNNGTWNVGGTITNLRLDQLNHITGRASLLFDIGNTETTGFIENFTMQPVDIHEYLNTGAAFLWLALPIPLDMVSVKLTMGSNASDLTTDLYTAVVNQPHDSNSFITGWNLLKYMLNSIVSVGNPDPKAINYIRIDITTTGENAIPNCNLDNLVVRKGIVYDMLYNSQYCIQDTRTKAFKQRTTANSDILPLEEDTYEILMLETALVEQNYLYANNFGASTDVTDIKSQLFDKYTQYKLNHTDESLELTESTYALGDYMNGYSTESIDNGWGNDDNDGGSQDRVDENNSNGFQ